MTYRHLFDHLGNPIAQRTRQPIGHTIIQRAGAAITLGMVLYMLWGPK